MSDERADQALPTAAALVCAVADRDRDEITRLLHTVTDWPALAIVLAGHIPADSPLTGRPVLTPDGIANVILDETATRYGVTIHQLASTDRRREVVDARAVAMAAMRTAGLTSVHIGRRLNKDHSTVLYAASRVGEHPRLRRVAADIAAIVCARPGVLGDADGETAA